MIDEIPEVNLSDEEKEVLNILKLTTPQGSFLNAFSNVVGQLSEEKRSELDSLLKEEISKEKYMKKEEKKELAVKKESIFERKVPGTQFRIKWVLVALVIIIVLGLLGYLFFCRTSTGEKPRLNFRAESDFSE